MENENHGNGVRKAGLGRHLVLGSILIILISGSIGFLAGGLGAALMPESMSLRLGKIFRLSEQSEPSKSRIVSRENIQDRESAVISTVEKASPSVVSIVITKDVPKFRNNFNPFDFFGFFGEPQADQGPAEIEKQKIGGGTGFFVSEDGLVVTNRHVVSDQQADYTVITSDGQEHKATVLARHPSLDIAVVKIEGSGFPVLELGDSANLKVGQSVVAIGNSLAEFSNTVSLGIVSGLRRSLVAGSNLGESEKLNNIIQTDAAINPGNSGGPLLDLDARVIGMNVAIAQGAENIGFAIPVDQIKATIEQVKSTGKITLPFLGVRYVPNDKQIQAENGLPYDYGMIVLRGQRQTDLAVVPGSPADKAGIVENDIILEIDGQKLDSSNSLSDVLANHKAGDSVNLKIWHKGDIRDVTVTLETRK